MADQQFITALTAAWTGMAVGATAVARNWTTTNPSTHPHADKLTDADLDGPLPAWGTDPDAETQSFGVVRTGFGWCEACAGTTAGVVTRNGFRCGEFANHPAGGAR